MNNTSTKTIMYIVHAAVIAALYVVLTMTVAAFDLASGAIQVRVSEVLTVLPFFTPAAIPGVTLGCLIANIVTGCALPDIVFGTLATLFGAVGTYLLRKNRFVCTLPPVLSNAIIIPFLLKYAYGIPGALWFFALTVGAGEVITCVILGQILISALMPVRQQLFGTEQVEKK
ncbi:MAG: QueT transporter family protein [Butyrivibrio sp.]|nr:QueT transporter family protein [Butyrivibrio sp.]